MRPERAVLTAASAALSARGVSRRPVPAAGRLEAGPRSLPSLKEESRRFCEIETGLRRREMGEKERVGARG